MPLVILALLGSAAYLLAAGLLTTQLARQSVEGHSARIASLVAIVFHAWFQIGGFRLAGGLDVHFLAALSEVALVMAVVTLAVSHRRSIQALGLVVFPLAALLLGLDGLFGTPTPSPAAQGWRITLHVIAALLAFATLSIAALVAIMLWGQERALRTRRLGGWGSWLPPLALAESVLFRLIAVGFVLLSATLLSGVLFVENLFDQHLAHKTVLSIVAWFVFGVLLVGRHRYGWRGARATRLVLVGMAVLALAFLGSKFVLELLLRRVA